MANIYDSLDFLLSLDGDLVLDSSGDVSLTDDHALVAVLQSIRERIRNLVGSWKLYPQVGVSRHPIGEFNTAENAEAWKEEVYSALLQDGLIDRQDLTIEIFPVAANAWVEVYTLRTAPSPLNGQVSGVQLFGFHYLDQQQLFFY